MFDRLYKLTIRSKALKNKNGLLEILGDSSQPSLGLDFSCSVNQSDSSSEGKVTISGLTSEHINLLGSIRRYNNAKNAAEHNTATLAVGYRDLTTGIVSPYYVILTGVIQESIPGPPPSRSLSIAVQLTNLKTVTLSEGDKIIQKASDAEGMPVIDWMTQAADLLMARANGAFTVIVDGTFTGWTMPALDMPVTYANIKNTAIRYGCTVYEQMAGETTVYGATSTLKSRNNIDDTALMPILKISDEALADYDNSDGSRSIVTVSQESGMIGIPRSIPQGAVADVILKDPIMPGSKVCLISDKFVQISSDSNLYTKGGIYNVMSTQFIGQFHGEMWLQRLTLNRGGAILKG